ncbi:hypothetical protein OROMI_005306 [Orobanche minor]
MESGEEVMGGDEERIYVSVRLRPLNQKEILRNDVSDWECVNDKTIVYKNVGLSASERSMYPAAYTFDRVFRSDCSTREVYEKGAKDVAISVVHGMNSSVFAYGQTSSGKTYTMTGITEYAISDVYEHIQKHPEREFVLKFSAMEIYNESVRDLLSVDSYPLRLLDDPERGTIVEKLTEEIVKDRNHVIHLLSICEAQRRSGETSLNEMSSRSHQIIRLTIESASRELVGRDNTSTLTASVNFVDLAGSERASQSLSAGTRLKEGCHINRSLLTLGTVIRKLSKTRSGHIPYRDSKLTRILQTSLSGNAKTAIICTMSPARSHVEQSRNTLLFASCAKEVTTNARVNVVMSDKALVKYLQRELARLQSELRSPQSTFSSSDYSAILREKDRQIEKLEEEINDFILQRDIAQSQVKDLLRMLGDDTNSTTQVGFGGYPHLRVHKSPENELHASFLPDPHSLDVVTQTCSNGHSRTSSLDHIVKVPYFDERFTHSNSSPRLLTSNSSERYSYHGWEDIERQSNGSASEDLCREVRCIETQESSEKGTIEINSSFPEIEVHEGGDGQNLVTPSSTTLEEDNIFKSIPTKNDDEKTVLSSKREQEKESSRKKERENSPHRLLDVPSLENPSYSTSELIEDTSSATRSFKLIKSRSCKASISDSGSPWLKTIDFSENVSFFGSERESVGIERKASPLSFKLNAENLSRKDSRSSPRNALDIEIDCPDAKFPTGKDVVSSMNGMKNIKTIDFSENVSFFGSERESVGIERKASPLSFKLNAENLSRKDSRSSPRNALDIEIDCPDAKFPTGKDVVSSMNGMKNINEVSMEHVFVKNQRQSKEIEPEIDESPKKNVKDVGLDPMEDEPKDHSNWPAEFKRLQQEIIELWHVCNVSLVHRTYFFMLFQGDPSDAIYLEVEMRRMKFLKQKFSQGDRTTVNGKRLTLTASEKALRDERRMLSQRMVKKLSEQERESLFLKWGIGLNTKLRRLQLAHRLWTRTDDMDHISDSAFLVAKLVGTVEPGQTHNKEMFGLNFTPRYSTRTYSLKRGLISFL